MACDHAHNGGMATWLLEQAAIHFHDSNCVGCEKRQPIRLPNISKFIAQRDADAERARVREEELQRQHQLAFDSRCSARAVLRSTSSVAVATFVDDLQTLDTVRDDASAQRLIESVRLAPELLTVAVTEHLFSLLENGEHWFDEVGLVVLGISPLDPVRLAGCAMRCLSEGRVLDLAAEVAANQVSHVKMEDVRNAVRGLALVACPPRSSSHFDDPRSENPIPLHQIFKHYPEQTALGIENLLSERHPFRVRIGASAVVALASEYPNLPVSLCRSLTTRLARADVLIDVESESELRYVVHDLTQALICAFTSDPNSTDIELMRYFEGASKDGEARLSGVYEKIIREASGSYGNDREIASLDVYRVALRRFVTLAGVSNNEGVVRGILEALRGDPGRLAALAREQMDMLLGAAALADSRLEASKKRSPLVTSPDLLDEIDQETRQSQFRSLRASFARWAIHGAAMDSSGLAVFTDFLARSNALSEGFKAAIVEELPPLMETGIGLSAVLPFLYTTMVGESNLGRAAAATAIGEIGSRRLAELPNMVGEAFLLMLSDPYVIVHKSAVRALRQVRLPDEFHEQVSLALGRLVIVYRGDKDQEFLLTCMDAYTSAERDNDQFKTEAGKVFIAILHKVKPDLLVRQGHRWLLNRLVEVEGYAELVLGLFEHCDSDYEMERVLDLVRGIPINTVGQHISSIKKTVAGDPLDPMVIGTFLEVLTRDGEWDAALYIAQSQLNAIPDNIRMRVRWLLAIQQHCQTEFELLIDQGKIEEALSIGKSWDAALAEINEIHKQNEKTDPFRFISQTP
ncbi:Hypothetical protein mma_1004 [Janthinobacterium sp. Marseille]|nr:Hypothetical protein mma_1004 [Janthinobacterium sp. Marseille]